MNNIIMRKAEKSEIDLMTKARVDYCLRDKNDITKNEYEDFYIKVREWTIRNVNENNYLGYFGYLNNEIVCFAGLLVFELPPVFLRNNRKQGYVLSFFTYPKYRKKGIGDKMMKYIIEDARQIGIDKLVLIATKEGEPLYRKNGFQEPSMLYMENKSPSPSVAQAISGKRP
jgi:GNAT superfamily N-acetyltransferase